MTQVLERGPIELARAETLTALEGARERLNEASLAAALPGGDDTAMLAAEQDVARLRQKLEGLAHGMRQVEAREQAENEAHLLASRRARAVRMLALMDRRFWATQRLDELTAQVGQELDKIERLGDDIRMETIGMSDADRQTFLLNINCSGMADTGWKFTNSDKPLRAAYAHGLSGLNKWTEAGQRAFGLDFLGTLGDLRGEAFDKLPSAMREAMGRYGIEAGQWNIIRKAEPERSGGATFVNARNIADRRVSDQLQEMVLAETARAVQENTASARALMQGGTRPGTLTGEFLRNSFQFKGFAVSLLMSQAQVLRELGPYRAGVYGAQFFVGMTLFGAASIQLREIAKGRDPRPMDDPEFWADAALQGGGAGIFGDIVGSFKSDRIDSLAGFALGPVYGLAKDMRSAVSGSMDNAETGEPGRPVQQGVRMAKRYLPGANLWYLRAAYERMILDRLSEAYDPAYGESQARVEQWAAENGQGLWWGPGEALPARGPELSNAFGGE